ncbi:MAG: hypothetical protein ABIP06_00260 [Pyrinomonadaceae bacterium]
MFAMAACSSSAPKPKTPLETLQTYAAAYKKKDYTTMKLLLSDATIKMHQQAAKDQNVILDDIVQRETLFLPDQKTAEFRNQKIDGDKATLEMKDTGGIWNMINFSKEEGIWKLDKQSFANQMIEQNDQDNKKLDELINQGK